MHAFEKKWRNLKSGKKITITVKSILLEGSDDKFRNISQQERKIYNGLKEGGKIKKTKALREYKALKLSTQDLTPVM